MMKHKVALKITFLLSAKLLLIEQWFEIAHAYRTVSWFLAYFALYLILSLLTPLLGCYLMF
jgi:hypothetical protein